MTLEQLRIFVTVAEREHMTAAARLLHLTQSAVSSAIAALEERHAVKLFHRVGRGIVLTEAGELFLPEARGLLARAEAAQTMLEELGMDGLGALSRGRLRLVASQTIAAYWLPPVLAAFRQRYPAIGVELAIANTEQAAAHVHDGLADLGIVEGEVDDPTLAQWPLGEDRLVLVSARPFAPGMTLPALVAPGVAWVMREQGSGTRSSFEEYLQAQGLDPDARTCALVLPSNESVRTAVEAGTGIAVLSALVVAPALAAGTLHAAPLAFPARAFHGLRHKERYRTRAADALLDLLEALA